MSQIENREIRLIGQNGEQLGFLELCLQRGVPESTGSRSGSCEICSDSGTAVLPKLSTTAKVQYDTARQWKKKQRKNRKSIEIKEVRLSSKHWHQ